MTKVQFLEHIKSHKDLSDEFKRIWIARVNVEGLTQEVINDFRDAIQDEIDAVFSSVGIEDSENDPVYKAAYSKMMAEIDTAEAEFNNDMADLEQKAKNIMNASVKQMEDAQAQAVRDSM